MTRLATPISDHTQPEFFYQHLTYVNLYQHAKNQAVLLICSRDIGTRIFPNMGFVLEHRK